MDAHFRLISGHLSRQSERDFPRRSVRFDYMDNTQCTLEEKGGNLVVHIFSLYTNGVELLLDNIFDKYKKKPSSDKRNDYSPSIHGCRLASEGLLCYMRWIQEPNLARALLTYSMLSWNNILGEAGPMAGILRKCTVECLYSVASNLSNNVLHKLLWATTLDNSASRLV